MHSIRTVVEISNQCRSNINIRGICAFMVQIYFKLNSSSIYTFFCVFRKIYFDLLIQMVIVIVRIVRSQLNCLFFFSSNTLTRFLWYLILSFSVFHSHTVAKLFSFPIEIGGRFEEREKEKRMYGESNGGSNEERKEAKVSFKSR